MMTATMIFFKVVCGSSITEISQWPEHKNKAHYMSYLCKNEANVAADSSGQLWHKRIGHMSEKGMNIQADKKLLMKVKGVH